MASFIRKVPTASGARAVRIVHKQGRQIDGHTITAKPHLSADAEQILTKLPPVAG